MTLSGRKTALAIGAVAVATALTLTGCAPTSTNPATKAAISQSDITKALDTPTTLTMWASLPNMQDEIGLFEKKYPKIKVNVVNISTLTSEYVKLRSALKAGKGLPDVAQIEYQYVSSFELTKSLADLTPFGAARLQSQFVPWVWKQVADSHGIWAVPQDSGPLGNLYRKDIYSAAGVTASPKTWTDFATAAAKIKTRTGSYISDLPGNDPAQMLGLFEQAGAKPFGYDGKKTVSINLNSPEAQKVVAFWQDLVKRNLVATDPDFADNWYQGIAKGKYASWQTGAWGPVFLQGTAKDTSGKWRAADIPQWGTGESVSGNWGGSTNAVLATSKNKIAAYELSKFINTDMASTLMFTQKQFLFPVSKATLASQAFSDQAPAFYGGQKVNALFGEVSQTVPTDFQWLPFMDYVFSSYNGTLGDAIANHGDMSSALAKWNGEVTGYAKQQGFTVK